MRDAGWVCGAALLLSCLRADPNHCANRDGDATCQQGGFGDYCSVCAGSNFGCVDIVPEDGCRVGDGPLESSSSGTQDSSSTSSDTDTASSSGPPPSCTLEGGLDPACPEENPYCIDGVCGTCDLAGVDFCGALDEAKPVCHVGWGRCVACTPEDASACSGARAWCGNDFTCTGCFEHAHCPSSACDLERGQCMDDDLVMHVDGSVCPEAGSGTENAPYCEIATAFDQIGTGERGTVILHGTQDAYEVGLILTTGQPRTVAVLGVDDAAIIVPDDGPAARAVAGMDLYISRVRLSSSGESAAQASGFGAALWLDDLTLTNNVTAVVVDRGAAHLRRVRIMRSSGDAVRVENSGSLFMESSIIVNGGASDQPVTALRVAGAASAGGEPSHIDVRYSTIANNSSSLDTGAGVYCVAGGGGTIRNSVIVGPDLSSMGCPWAQTVFSVHDNADAPTGSDNHRVETFNELWWLAPGNGDYHVRKAVAEPVFGGRARWELGDPIADYDGVARPAHPGARNYAGADEP